MFEATFEENLLTQLSRIADAMELTAKQSREYMDFEKERAAKAEAAQAQIQQFFGAISGGGPSPVTAMPPGMLPEAPEPTHRRPRRPQHS